jgi:hypothetical protein
MIARGNICPAQSSISFSFLEHHPRIELYDGYQSLASVVHTPQHQSTMVFT